jgi:hypothetical protein
MIERSEISQSVFVDPVAVRPRRMTQEERLLGSLVTSPEVMGAIVGILSYFGDKEFRKTIPARDSFIKRLVSLTNGERVPVVVFNCLDFTWKKVPGEYPKAVILDDTSTSICDYFQQQMRDSVNALNALSPRADAGGVDLCIIIPDSELFDERVFPFLQSETERTEIAEQVKADLSRKFDGFQGGANPVMFWSEYCAKYSLQSPFSYTGNNASLLFNAKDSDGDEQGRNLFRSVLRQQANSKDHFINKGLGTGYVEYEIPPEEMLERIIWYCAMYMGEGQALAESNGIVINFEDFRVGKWYNIGSSNRLPIITPVNPNEYYRWRNKGND